MIFWLIKHQVLRVCVSRFMSPCTHTGSTKQKWHIWADWQPVCMYRDVSWHSLDSKFGETRAGLYTVAKRTVTDRATPIWLPYEALILNTATGCTLREAYWTHICITTSVKPLHKSVRTLCYAVPIIPILQLVLCEGQRVWQFFS